MGLLDGKVAIVTGAGGGIGRGEALALAKEGAKVVVNDLGGARDGSGGSNAMADVVVDEIKKAGGEAAANYDSVSTQKGGQAIVQTALDSFGKLDIVVNNAGILRDRSLLKMTEDEWDLVISVHLKGTFNVTQAAGRHMKERGEGGRIINTTSTSGLVGNFGQANYGAAKAGIFGFTRVASIEFKKYNITANVICPVALTRMTEDLGGMKTAKNMGPEHIAPAAVYLASEAAKDITGRVIFIGAGTVAAFSMERTKGIQKSEGVWTVQEIIDQADAIFAK